MPTTAPEEAQPGEVDFSLVWDLSNGSLTGELLAQNVCDRAIRLSGKPGLTPRGEDGEPLDAPTVVTAEYRPPGYVALEPGERARARVGWGAWNGPPASGTVTVKWDAGEVDIEALGPRQPDRTGPANNLWSSWFERVG